MRRSDNVLTVVAIVAAIALVLVFPFQCAGAHGDPASTKQSGLNLAITKWTADRDKTTKAAQTLDQAVKSYSMAIDSMTGLEINVIQPVAEASFEAFFTKTAPMVRAEKLEKRYPMRVLNKTKLPLGYSGAVGLFLDSKACAIYVDNAPEAEMMVLPIARFDKGTLPTSQITLAFLQKMPHTYVGYIIVRKYPLRWIAVATIWDPEPRRLQLKLPVPMLITDAPINSLPQLDAWELREWRAFFMCDEKKSSTKYCPINIVGDESKSNTAKLIGFRFAKGF